MAVTSESRFFTLAFSVVFFISFYLLKIVFDSIEWSIAIELLVTSVLSSLVAALLVPYLNNEKKRKLGIVLAGLYSLALAGTSLFLQEQHEGYIDTQLAGQWATEEHDGDNFVLAFFEANRVRLISPANEARGFSYTWKKNRLKLYDENKKLVFDWVVQLDSDKLILHQGADILTFHKQE